MRFTPSTTEYSPYHSLVNEYPTTKRYMYARVSIEENGIRYHFYCSNIESEGIRDSIFLRKAHFVNQAWVDEAEDRVVLSHGAEEKPGEYIWDKKHACDPAVTRGRFGLNNQIYNYALFYTGIRQDGDGNSVGIAVAHALEGPWYKRNGPLLEFSKHNNDWGLGQPSVTGVNPEQGEVLLFYTRGDAVGSRICRLYVNLADVQDPIFLDNNHVATSLEAAERALPITGLTQETGTAEIFLNNAVLAYYNHDNMNLFWMIREGHPYPIGQGEPDFISTFIQVATASADTIWSGVGSWEVFSNFILPNSLRSHNPRLVTNAYGVIPNPDALEGSISYSKVGTDSYLWSYRPHGFKSIFVNEKLHSLKNAQAFSSGDLFFTQGFVLIMGVSVLALLCIVLLPCLARKIKQFNNSNYVDRVSEKFRFFKQEKNTEEVALPVLRASV